ncbi:hypothetical protein M430DRAFT_35087 [Amorphotheca resinae ATCC 22711]|uniref:Secreted protein n=1 Tax=Amorphotheca resinae ATCC 22711 TaxID=857342 RepID=A0A2T3B224_AMORE|nr:hypothetical protein M430DRAFT_35087 [Amorphotheca resinae ATCC 22711]PSS18610.1 hypothetical protein M430DRAFT_35087 [Amorphotheca resinae ATCC 22711]
MGCIIALCSALLTLSPSRRSTCIRSRNNPTTPQSGNFNPPQNAPQYRNPPLRVRYSSPDKGSSIE